MNIVLVTESAGSVGSESVVFCERGFTVVGIDNNMRQVFFGEDASTEWNRTRSFTGAEPSREDPRGNGYKEKWQL